MEPSTRGSAGGLRRQEAVEAAPVHRRDALTWWSAGAGVLAAVALVAVTSRALGDDSWITLSYARSLAEHGHWGLLPGRTANTATSPLNVWLLAAGLAMSGRPAVAVGVALAVALALVGWWAAGLARILRVSPALPFVLLGLLVTSPLLVSTVGMETYLGAAVVVGLARSAVSDRWVAVGVLTGVAVLVRPDLAVPAVVLVGLLAPAARWVAAGALAALVALPWHVWSWFELGGFLPDTFAFKTVRGPGPRFDMATSVVTYYGDRMPGTTAITALLVLGGATCAGCHARIRSSTDRVVVAAMGAGAAHWAALWALGAYPQPWYFGPLVIGAALAVSVSVAALAGRRLISVGVPVVVYCLVAGVSAGAGGLPWATASMNSNWAHPAEYARIGSELRPLVGTRTVASPGEIGELAYFCRCAILDQFSDRALARPLLVARHEQAGWMVGKVLTLNSWNRPETPPPRIDDRLVFLTDPDQPLPPSTLRWWWTDPPSVSTPFRLALVRG